MEQDYRVLHALLCQLSGRAASESLLRFLRVDEMLTDIADDLYDYEKDCGKNSFNVLRGCVAAQRKDDPSRILGHEAPLELATKIGELEKEHEVLLQSLAAPQREAYVESRRHAMSKGAHKWTFPRVVLPHDEHVLRMSMARTDESHPNPRLRSCSSHRADETAFEPHGCQTASASNTPSMTPRLQRGLLRARRDEPVDEPSSKRNASAF